MNVTWSAVTRSPVTKRRALWNLPGNEILLLHKQNYTIKVFERLYASLKRTDMSQKQALRLKMDIFQDYGYPKPFPRDMFQRLPEGSPNQAYLMLGQKGTGKPNEDTQNKSNKSLIH